MWIFQELSRRTILSMTNNEERKHHHRVPDPFPSPRLEHKSPEPLEAEILKNSRSARTFPGEKIKGAPDSHRHTHAWEVFQVIGNPQILRRRAEGDEEEVWRCGVDAVDHRLSVFRSR